MVMCNVTGVGCLNQKLLAMDCLLHKGPGQGGRRRGELGGGQASLSPHGAAGCLPACPGDFPGSLEEPVISFHFHTPTAPTEAKAVARGANPSCPQSS